MTVVWGARVRQGARNKNKGEHISTSIEDKEGGKEGRANNARINKRGRLSLIKVK